MNKGKKVTIIGAGNVGASVAFALSSSGTAAEIVIVDINKDKAFGEALDIYQGTAMSVPVNVHAGDYPDTEGSDVVIVTSGAPRKPGQSRIDLVQGNADIMNSIMPKVIKYCPNAVYIIVSNPVDVLTYQVATRFGLSRTQVIGTGTLLDSSRLRAVIAKLLGVNSHSVHGYVLGEHGDTSVIPWSLLTIGGVNIEAYSENTVSDFKFDKINKEEIEREVRMSGATVIKAKGATYYAISLAVKKLVEAILRDSNSVMVVSAALDKTDGCYGISDVALSLPYIIGARGIHGAMCPQLTVDEVKELLHSANTLKSVIENINF
ncbi:MAG: L-lactate dehydrogenase [Clostridiales bacterium]|nr:L-lactate dehydrogenase [Clostridiales bacterium]